MQVNFEDLAHIIKKVPGIKISEPLPETTVQSLEMDSLDVLEVIMAVEERYGKDIDPAALSQCATLADVCKLIETHA